METGMEMAASASNCCAPNPRLRSLPARSPVAPRSLTVGPLVREGVAQGENYCGGPGTRSKLTVVCVPLGVT